MNLKILFDRIPPIRFSTVNVSFPLNETDICLVYGVDVDYSLFQESAIFVPSRLANVSEGEL